MNTQELINSGILELYVLGLASPEDVVLVQDALSNAEVQEEVQRIENTLLNIEAKQTPSDKVYNKLVGSLDFSEEVNKAEVSEEPADDKAKIIVLQSKAQQYQTWMRAAVVALVVSLGLNGLQLNNHKSQIVQIAELQNLNQVLASDIKVVRNDNVHMDNMLSFFEVGEVQSVKLKCVDKDGKDFGIVYWNMESGKISFNASNLTPLDEEHSYQLWCMVDGKPVDLGVIPNDSVGQDRITMLKDTKISEAFCVTIEPYGGKPQPTLENLFVMAAMS